MWEPPPNVDVVTARNAQPLGAHAFGAERNTQSVPHNFCMWLVAIKSVVLIFRCQGFWAAWRLRWRADGGAVGRNPQAALRLRRGIRQADESNSVRDHEDDDECELCATPASQRDQRPFYSPALSMEDSRVRVHVLVVQDRNALMPMGDQARVRFCERVPDDRCEKQAKLFAVSFFEL